MRSGYATILALMAAPALAPAAAEAQAIPIAPGFTDSPLPPPSSPATVEGSSTPPAKPEVPGRDTVAIGGRGAVNGAGAINGAAGVNNMQANAGLVAKGDLALATGSLTQLSHTDGSAGGNHAQASVAAGALAGSSGWLAVAGAAGADNQQVNLAIMAFGIEGLVVADSLLAQTRASTIPMGENGAADATPSRSVAIGQGAFKDSNGVVQLTLVGGDRNTSANTFALLVASGVKPE